MRLLLTWILVLNLLHLPVLFPDLDGECRGTPIHSLTEAHAWHVVMFGVRPNDDIDQGPIRTDDSGLPETPADSPFGDSAVNTVSSAPLVHEASFAPALSALSNHTRLHATEADQPGRIWNRRNAADSVSAQAVRSRLCVWRI